MEYTTLIGVASGVLFFLFLYFTAKYLMKRVDAKTAAEKKHATKATIVGAVLCIVFFVGTIFTAMDIDFQSIFSISGDKDYLETGTGEGWVKLLWADSAVTSESIYLYPAGQTVGHLNDINTGYTQSTTTGSSDGDFDFVDLAPGTYEVYFPEDLDDSDPDYFGKLFTAKMPKVAESDDDEKKNFSPANFYIKEFGLFDYTGCSFKDATAEDEDATGDDGDNYTLLIQNSEDKTCLCAEGYRGILKFGWVDTESNSGATGVDASDITVSGDESKSKLRHSEDLGYYLIFCDWTGAGAEPSLGKSIVYHSGNAKLTEAWMVVIGVPDLSSAVFSTTSTGVQVTITITPMLQYKDADGNWVDAWEADTDNDIALLIDSTA